MADRKKLILLTTTFPFDHTFEGNFLNPELPFLRKQFDDILILPTRASLPVPDLGPGVRVSTEIAEHLMLSKKTRLPLYCLRGFEVGKPAQPRPPYFSLAYPVEKAQLGLASMVHECLESLLHQKEARDLQHTLFYSYWCKYTALALAWLKMTHPKLHAVARAHRGDLYAMEAPFKIVTGQKTILEELDHIFCISDHGKAYLRQHFPVSGEKITTEKLGTPNPGIRAAPPSDSIQICSCSRIEPVKRVGRILEAAICAAQKTEVQVHWKHFGDGKARSSVAALVSRGLPSNLTVTLEGSQPLREILKSYRDHSPHVFVNASRSEGIPVSIMEAMSCGIPCIGPAVGGIPELIAEDSGGILVASDAPAGDLAEAILNIAGDDRAWQERSEAAYQKWQSNHDAEKNFERFSYRLVQQLEKQRHSATGIPDPA
ncbi:MAG: glycosyltransferase [Opitutales bacterium]